MSASQPIQPAQQNQVTTNGQQQPTGQLICFLVVDNQQPDLQDCLLSPNPDETLQHTVSCLCHRPRKSTQHIRTFKLLWKYSIFDELPTDQHTTVVFTTQQATTRCTLNNWVVLKRTDGCQLLLPPGLLVDTSLILSSCPANCPTWLK